MRVREEPRRGKRSFLDPDRVSETLRGEWGPVYS